MRRLILFPVLFTLFGLPCLTLAEEADAFVDSVFARLDVLTGEIENLQNQLPGLVGEDSMIIDHEMVYAQLKAMDQVFLFIDHLIERKDERPIRVHEQELLNNIPGHLKHVEKNVTDELRKIRMQRDQVPPQNMGEYEEKVSELMTNTTNIQKIIFQYLTALEKLGQPDSIFSNHLQRQVQNRTRILIGRLRIALNQQSSLQRRIPTPAVGDDAILLLAAQIRVQSNITNLRELIALMKKMQLDTTGHEAFLIQSTGQLTSSDLASGALMRFLNNWFQRSSSYLQKNGANILVKTLLIIGLLIFFRYLGILVSKLTITIIDASSFQPSTLLRNMIQNLTSNIILLIGVLIALFQLGISLGPMLAGLGVVGFIMGFALQDTIANFASGIMILFYRPYDVGDMVETGTVFGKVRHMSLVSTTILTIDNQTLVVPNNMIWGNVIKNVTAQNLRRVDMVFGISYSDDVPKVEKILTGILEDHEKVLKIPAPQVRLHELADSSVNFVVRPWVRTADYWDVHWDVTREVKMRFDAEGVKIPFPQQDVHLFENKSEG
jgi:small conductance mechanosensitive channel